MRILNISQNHYIAGGMDRVMFDQTCILEAHGHEVVPFTAADPTDAPSPWADRFPKAARTDSTPLSEVPATLWRPRAARALANLLRDEQFDVIHLHSWFKRLSPAILPALARARAPVVQTLHDYRTVCSRSTMFRDGGICYECAGGRRWPALRHRCNGSVAKTIASLADMEIADRLGYRGIVRRFLPVSEFQRQLLRTMGLPDDRMRTLPNPVAIPARPAPPPGKGAPVLFVGRMEGYKGANLFAELARGRPDAVFAMAGEGSLHAAIAASRPANLQMLGQLDQATLAQAVAAATCVVVPSLAPETFGLAAAEAMAAGKAVIASRTGGLTEIVRDGIDGILVEPGDVRGLSDALDRILADPERARAMGVIARKRVTETYSGDRFHERLIAIYDEVMMEEAVS
ncbi:hypothetical protein ASG67_15470 [Sphingomonas sp. Leaf339]|uniref:glycosyltransferase family 4 protein n=1 Tax=Sphingomonas sp. Leaf339 TaxID=1736343 RepID=UPI000701B672|nr:glycosyltransferase family 4 protein [Sphingomonas sp. Leaf339]KQU46003.1 hypothetical protein ASG67_15470 [Sphingomonas sp. Leaf339]